MRNDVHDSPRRAPWFGPFRFLRARFLVGVEFLAPFAITYIVVTFLIGLVTGISEPLFRDWFGVSIPGLGFILLFGTPLLFGTLTLHFFGTKAMLAVEAGASRLPIVGPVFSVSHQIVSAFGGEDLTGFKTVVIVEYPRKGIHALGFLTRVLDTDDGDQLALVYLPSPPTPHTGALILVPVCDIRQVDIKVNDLMKTLMSAGIAAPAKLPTRPLEIANFASEARGESRRTAH